MRGREEGGKDEREEAWHDSREVIEKVGTFSTIYLVRYNNIYNSNNNSNNNNNNHNNNISPIPG